MTPSESKLRILAEWRTWICHRQPADGHTATDASDFVIYIRQNHPDLISFESDENMLDVVRRWLQDAGLIK